MSGRTVASTDRVLDRLDVAVRASRTATRRAERAWVAARARVTARARVAAIVGVYTGLFFVALPALLWALGGRLDALFDLPPASRAWSWAGAVGLGWGVPWLAWSVVCLRRYGSGWPISHLPPRRLVRVGPYAVMRHPIYVGYTATFAGAGLLAGSLGRGLLAAGLLTVGWLLYASGFEEPRLIRRYGAAYEEGRAVTPVFPGWPGRRVRAAVRTVLRAVGRKAWSGCRAPLESFANRTVLFRIGPSLWATYGVCVAAGTAVMAVGLAATLIDAGVPPGRVAVYLVGLAAAMLAGGRAMWLLYQAGAPCARLHRRVGFVSWGGYLALVAGAVAFARLAALDGLWLLDRTLFWGFIASGFGRLGCLSYGCCYGRPAAWGIRWTDPQAKVIREHGPEAAVPRIPTQLFAALLAFAIAALLGVVSRSDPPAGTVAGVGLLVYALGRFGIDCLREERRFGSWGLTSGQIGAALAGAVGLAFLLAVDGPPGWSAPAYSVSLFSAPLVWGAVLVAVALVALVCGLHWREVGRW